MRLRASLLGDLRWAGDTTSFLLGDWLKRAGETIGFLFGDSGGRVTLRDMLCYVMLCYVMLGWSCYVILCYGMLWYVML